MNVESGEEREGKISPIFIVLLYLLGLWPGEFLERVEVKQKSERDSKRDSENNPIAGRLKTIYKKITKQITETQNQMDLKPFEAPFETSPKP
jgi:hypothetical protein